MIGHCEDIHFIPSDKHYLAPFEEVHCYIDPHDGKVMLPIDGIYKMMKLWKFEPTVETIVQQVEPTAEVTLRNLPELLPMASKDEITLENLNEWEQLNEWMKSDDEITVEQLNEWMESADISSY